MKRRTTEADVVAKVADDYRERGYDVIVEPAGPHVPDFLLGYRPDLIARSANDSVVVEVKVGTQTSVADRFREIAERVNRQPGWRFSLVFVNPDQPDQISAEALPTLPQLQDRVRNAEMLVQTGQIEAAFLLSWSALEGIMRLLGQRAHLPVENLPPSTLFRELYSAGEISRNQFEQLLRLLPLRNQLVHGFGRTAAVEVGQLQELVRLLLTELMEPGDTTRSA